MSDIASFRIGDRVYRLNQNGRPMLNSTGTGKLTGVVESIDDTYHLGVHWTNPGMSDPVRTYDPAANLLKVETL